MKKLLTIFLIVLLGACAASSSKDTSLSDVKKSGKLVIGYTEYPPMGFSENNVVTGFDIDIAREVAKRLGVEAVFQIIDWDAKVLELNSKNIDVIWNGLTITAEREKEILFSKPYFDNRIVILTLSTSSVDSIANLSGLNVGVELQSSGQSALEKSSVFASLKEMVKYSTISEAILDLQAGGIDAIVADEIFARYAVSKNPTNYRIATEVFNSENYGIGFRLADKTLRDKIDLIIDEIAADKTGLAISKKWFGEDLLKR
jgi:polar amino acid transport system substrate-binding protein